MKVFWILLLQILLNTIGSEIFAGRKFQGTYFRSLTPEIEKLISANFAIFGTVNREHKFRENLCCAFKVSEASGIISYKYLQLKTPGHIPAIFKLKTWFMYKWFLRTWQLLCMYQLVFVVLKNCRWRKKISRTFPGQVS